MTDPTGRRARLIVGSLVVPGLLIAGAGYARSVDASGWITGSLLAAAVLGGIVVFTVGTEPFRRLELRRNIGREAPKLSWREWSFVIAPLPLAVVLLHYALGVPWGEALARAAGIIVYFAVFVPLGRIQRRGVAPYWRPAWYGFLAAGSLAGLAWAAAAGARAADGLISGNTWALMHYGYVRWAMRGATGVAAEPAATTDEAPVR